jgi:hypothetical protein
VRDLVHIHPDGGGDADDKFWIIQRRRLLFRRSHGLQTLNPRYLACYEDLPGSILVNGEGIQMSADVRRNQTSGELEQLTSAIREMASRVNAQFVVDDTKTQNFLAAGEQRDKAKKSA